MRAKIALLMPTYADIPPKVYASHMNAALVAQQKGLDIKYIGVSEKMLLCTGRNRLTTELIGTDCTHALCFDSDVVVPSWAVSCMHEIDKDIVSGIYFQKVESPFLPVIYTKAGVPWNKRRKGIHHHILQWVENTYFPIDAAGLGCALLKREVFEKIPSPWFHYNDGLGKGPSEDIRFCMKAKRAGFEIFADGRVLCGHIGEKGVITYEDFKQHRDELNISMVKYDPETNKSEVIYTDIVQVAG